MTIQAGPVPGTAPLPTPEEAASPQYIHLTSPGKASGMESEGATYTPLPATASFSMSR